MKVTLQMEMSESTITRRKVVSKTIIRNIDHNDHPPEHSWKFGDCFLMRFQFWKFVTIECHTVMLGIRHNMKLPIFIRNLLKFSL